MIGPLSSPALVKKQVIGVFDKKLLKIFANALKSLNIKFAWIVNSDDGLDEISPYAKTKVMQLKNNEITEIIIDPKKLKVNADKFDNLVAGLVVSEKYENFELAYNYARGFIKTGAPYKHLLKIQNVQ